MKLPSMARILSLALVLLGGTVILPLPAVAKPSFPPAKFENLKVLPKDMPTRQLIETMKKISQSLGVRCYFCHVGREGMELAEFNFVSDEKREKKAARIMMRMTHEINTQFMAEIAQIVAAEGGEHEGHDGHADHDHEGGHVTCMTCHRGKHHPEP